MLYVRSSHMWEGAFCGRRDGNESSSEKIILLVRGDNYRIVR